MVNRQIGFRDFKYVGKNCPYAQVSCYGTRAVAANALSMVSYVGDVRTHDSRTDSRKDLQTCWMD